MRQDMPKWISSIAKKLHDVQEIYAQAKPREFEGKISLANLPDIIELAGPALTQAQKRIENEMRVAMSQFVPQFDEMER